MKSIHCIPLCSKYHSALCRINKMNPGLWRRLQCNALVIVIHHTWIGYVRKNPLLFLLVGLVRSINQRSKKLESGPNIVVVSLH